MYKELFALGDELDSYISTVRYDSGVQSTHTFPVRLCNIGRVTVTVAVLSIFPHRVTVPMNDIGGILTEVQIRKG